MFKKSLFWLVLAALMNSNNLYANRVYSNISNSNIASLFYKAAQTGNVDAVKNLKAQGYKIDTPDSNGNTALCLAYLNADVRTRDTLLKAGASKKASCMKFSKLRQTKLGKQNSGMIYLNGGLSDTIYSENARLDVSSDGFSWMPWIVGGLVVGGTVAAVMAGGGGGGNNNNVADVQDETIVPDEEFLADVELSGCLGGHWENRNGIPVCTCDDGYELKNGVCVEMPAE